MKTRVGAAIAAAAALALLLLAAAAPPALADTTRLDLGRSASWELTNGNGSVRLGNFTLPNYALEVLWAAGVIQDPLYRFGERETRWVALDRWTFSARWTLAGAGRRSLLRRRQVLLLLGGVDTFADVELNGERVLRTDNFHRSWRVPVRRLLRPGANELSISIRPAFTEALERKARHPYTIPTMVQVGAMGVFNFARKPASDFGWDWGPALAASGVHGAVELLGFDSAIIHGSHLVQRRRPGGSFLLSATASLLPPPDGDRGRLSLSLPSLGLSASVGVRLGGAAAAAAAAGAPALAEAPVEARERVSLEVPAGDVRLWWPRGYGPQHLYEAVLCYRPEGAGACEAAARGAEAQGAAPGPPRGWLRPLLAALGGRRRRGRPPAPAPRCSCLSRRVGLRTVELATLPLPEAARELLGPGYGGWDDPPAAAAAEGQVAPQWPALDPTKGPVFPSGQWGRVGPSGVWSFLPNPVNQTAAAAEAARWPHSGAPPEAPPGEQLIAGFGAISGNQSWGDQEGESFYLRVNGVPVFAKGANLVPLRALPARAAAAAAAARALAAAAADSSLNLLRVWGGGAYQADALYSAADEAGLLVWQEAMFACGPYPRDPAFLRSVEAEVEEQARRLSWHASVALWGGNNEVEASLDWFNATRANPQLFAGDYIALFLDTVRAAVKRVVPNVPFVDSSPSNGAAVEEQEGQEAGAGPGGGAALVKRWGNSGSPLYGDVHYYNYSGDCESFRTFPAARFVSEFGYQSYPTPATYREAVATPTATSAGDWAVGAEMTEHRQRHGNGTVELVLALRRHFRTPGGVAWSGPDAAADASLFDSFLFLTHVQQARCYEAAITYWRRLRSQPRALTMGVIYWQLNDVWAGASWSGIDVAGRWKPLQYTIRRVFADFAVQAVQEGGTVQIFLVNDHGRPVKARVAVSLLSLDDTAESCEPTPEQEQQQQQQEGGARRAPTAPVASIEAAVPARNAVRAWTVGTAELLALRPGCTRATCFVRVTAAAEVAGGEAPPPRVPPSSADLWLVPFKDVRLPEPRVSLGGFRQESPTVVSFALSSSRPAAYVALDAGPLLGRFSDGAATVHPCQPLVLSFESHGGPVGAEQLRRALSATSLYEHQRFGGAAAPEAAGAPGGAAAAALERAPRAAPPAGQAAAAAKEGRPPPPRAVAPGGGLHL